jgi:uncharacterized protein Usg
MKGEQIMAEVKTYKCDICGKVYHREENEDHFMTITHQPLDGEKEEKFEYQYLCDGCIRNVHEVIDNPELLKHMREHNDRFKRYISGYKDIISKIHYKLNKFASFWQNLDDPEHYMHYVDDFVNNYNALEAAYERGKKILRWASGILGGVIG